MKNRKARKEKSPPTFRQKRNIDCRRTKKERSPYLEQRFRKPTTPIKPETRSQADGGTGTAESESYFFF